MDVNSSLKDILSLFSPLGQVALEVMVNGNAISAVDPMLFEKVSKESFLAHWTFEDVQIELLKILFTPKLPSKMQVSGCMARWFFTRRA